MKKIIVLSKETVRIVRGRIPVIAGTGSNSTATAIESSQKAEALGVDGFLQVVPYYNKPSKRGCFSISKLFQKPSLCPYCYIIFLEERVEHVSRYHNCLSEISNIVGIKVTSGDLEQVKAIHAKTTSDFFNLFR